MQDMRKHPLVGTSAAYNLQLLSQLSQERPEDRMHLQVANSDDHSQASCPGSARHHNGEDPTSL
jgi:hypothetical protein